MYIKNIEKHGKKAKIIVDLNAIREKTIDGSTYHKVTVQGINIDYLNELNKVEGHCLKDVITKQEELFYNKLKEKSKSKEDQLLEDLGFTYYE